VARVVGTVLLVMRLLVLLFLVVLLLLVILRIAADRRILVVILLGAAGGGAAVTPATRRRATAPATLTTDGPGAHALRLLDPFGDSDLFRLARIRRVTRATIGPPRGREELQSTLVAISGVDRPVPAAFALSNGVPISRRGCGGQGDGATESEPSAEKHGHTGTRQSFGTHSRSYHGGATTRRR
jgi:hypothetical protein